MCWEVRRADKTGMSPQLRSKMKSVTVTLHCHLCRVQDNVEDAGWAYLRGHSQRGLTEEGRPNWGGKAHFDGGQNPVLAGDLRLNKKEEMRGEHQHSSLCFLSVDTVCPAASCSHHHAFPTRRHYTITPWAQINPSFTKYFQVFSHNDEKITDYEGLLFMRNEASVSQNEACSCHTRGMSVEHTTQHLGRHGSVLFLTAQPSEGQQHLSD